MINMINRTEEKKWKNPEGQDIFLNYKSMANI